MAKSKARKTPAKRGREATKATASGKRTGRKASGRESAGVTVTEALAWLERRGTKKNVAELARYGIDATRPFGVTVGDTKRYAREIGRDHALALALWESGRYEARLLAAFVDEPERVTARQMNAWAADFDNWAVVDTVCFHLFDRCKPAWSRIPVWAKSKAEFTKRCAFALLWSLAAHDEDAPDAWFLDCLPLLERGARDDRNFVKKSVDMALRSVGRRNPKLHAAAIATAERLARSDEKTPRWIGRHALRELESAAVKARVRGR
jgi:3-methyladenine DNA glycosylase AlkD